MSHPGVLYDNHGVLIYNGYSYHNMMTDMPEENTEAIAFIDEVELSSLRAEYGDLSNINAVVDQVFGVESFGNGTLEDPLYTESSKSLSYNLIPLMQKLAVANSQRYSFYVNVKDFDGINRDCIATVDRNMWLHFYDINSKSFDKDLARQVMLRVRSSVFDMYDKGYLELKESLGKNNIGYGGHYGYGTKEVPLILRRDQVGAAASILEGIATSNQSQLYFCVVDSEGIKRYKTRGSKSA